MRLALSIGILSLAGLLGCAPGGRSVSAQKPVPTAAPTQPAHLVVIDVRTDEEWAAEHVAGAAHLPLDQVRERIGTLVPDRQTAIGVYCAHGGRAGRAAEILQAMGYTHVENLGGLDDAKKKLSNAGATP